jgi:hypothetical protein
MISGVPVNMTEVYPDAGPFRCEQLAQVTRPRDARKHTRTPPRRLARRAGPAAPLRAPSESRLRDTHPRLACPSPSRCSPSPSHLPSRPRAQMRMQMPFGDLRATLSNRAEAEAAAVHVPGRALPELVYAMFVPLAKRIESVNEAYEVRAPCRSARAAAAAQAQAPPRRRAPPRTRLRGSRSPPASSAPAAATPPRLAPRGASRRCASA